MFEGFFERLNKIDMKQSHSMQSASLFDNLTSEQQDVELNSNFIQLIAQLKQDQNTIDFRRLLSKVQGLAYSYPLLVKNKQEVLKVLVGHLETSGAKAIQAGVVQLLVALVKDFRSDLYLEFMQIVLPALLKMLDIQNLETVDTFFTLLSFALKYLLKDIRADLKNFFGVYFELVAHRNRFIRKFACQSFAYVLRKVEITQDFIALLFDPVQSEHFSEGEEQIVNYRLFGLADMLFEVIYGASESLHSKFDEIIGAVLEFGRLKNSKAFDVVIRCLYMKLLLEVKGNE